MFALQIPVIWWLQTLTWSERGSTQCICLAACSFIHLLTRIESPLCAGTHCPGHHGGDSERD